MDKNRFAWPGRQKAAISLTYDDGYDSNVDISIPDLEERDFRGTFYLCPGATLSIQAKASQWKDAFTRGHEIGNHSWSHPCVLESYSVKRYQEEESGITEDWLNKNVGIDENRTFAYPCGNVLLGSGTEAQKQSAFNEVCINTFIAARTAGGGPIDPHQVMQNRFLLPSTAVTWGHDKPDIGIAFCQEALKTGGWSILGFHNFVEGLATGDLQTSRAVHCGILDWIKEREEELWVAPLRDIYTHIRDFPS